MQRSGAATCRFYAAFYQWTVHGRSANPARRCTGANIVPRRGQSTRTETYTPAGSAQSTSRENPGPVEEFVGTAELLRNEPIQSTVERPIGSLDAWSHAVREKTKDRVTIEISVPTWVLRAKDVAKRAEVHEVRVGVPEHKNGSRDNDLCPVILSGDFSDVKAVWKSIYFNTGRDAQTSESAKVEALAPAETARPGSRAPSLEQPKVKTPASAEPTTTPPTKIKRILTLPASVLNPLATQHAQGYFKKEFNVAVKALEDRGGQVDYTLEGTEHQVNRVSALLKEIPTWVPAEVKNRFNDMRYIATKGEARTIVSQSEVPSSEMRPWQAYIRRYYDDQIHEEFCLPESIWQRLAECGVVKYFAKQSFARLEPSEVHEQGDKRCVFLRGNEVQVNRAKGFLQNLNVPNAAKIETTFWNLYGAVHHPNRAGVILRTELPSDKLVFWQKVIRKRERDHLEIEHCLPESVWQRLLETGITDYLHVQYSIHAESSGLYERGEKRCIYTKGVPQDMNKASAFLANFQYEYQREGVFAVLQKFVQSGSERLEEQTTQDLQLPETVWSTLARNAAVRFYRRLHNVEVSVLEDHDGSRNISLKGPPRAVHYVSKHLERTSLFSQADFEKHLAFMRSVSFRGTDVISQEELPSEKLGIWWTVVRKNSDGQTELEFCLPESMWQATLKNDIEDYFRSRFSVRLEPSELYDNGERRCVYLYGDASGVSKAKNFFLNLRTEDHSKDAVARSMQHAFEKFPASQAADQTTTGTVQKENSTERNHTATSSGSSHDVKPEVSRSPDAVSKGSNRVVPREQTERDKKARSELVVRAVRYSVPEYLRKELESSDTRSIQHIKDHSGLEALRHRPMHGSKHYLQLVGTNPSRERAKALLQEGIDRHQRDTGVVSPNIEELVIPTEAFRLPDATHFARIMMPGNNKTLSNLLRGVGRAQVVRGDYALHKISAGGYELQGTAEILRDAVPDLQSAYDEHCRKRNIPSRAIEVLLEGRIEDRPGDTGLNNESASTVRQPIVVDHQAASQPVAGHSDEPIDNLQKQYIAEAEAAAAEVQAAIDAAKAERQLSKADEQPSSRQPDNQQPGKDVSPQLGDDMRSALRLLTQPVALLVAQGLKEAGKPSEHALRGVTVSSFCAVALNPVPIVSFNLRVPSRSWDAISTTNRLRAYLLRASPEGAAAAHAFTLPYEQPHEPFEHLRQIGAHVFVSQRSKTAPPKITWNNATTAAITMRVLPEKCIMVGDHVVVLAQVEQVDRFEDDGHSGAGALAYGMKGYRRLGDEIKPMDHAVAAASPANAASTELKPAEPAPVEESQTNISATAEAQPEESAIEEVAESDSMVDLFEAFAAGDAEESEVPAASKDISDLGPSSPLLDEESLKRVLEESETSYSSEGLPSQTAAKHSALEEALNAVAGAYKDFPDTTTSSQPAPASPGSAEPTGQPSNEPPKAGHTDRSSSAGSGAWGLNGNSNPLNRSFSSWARMPFRTYSTSSNNPSQPPISQKILKTTVSDYLCQPPTHRKRYPDLIKTRRNAERLEKVLDSGSYVTPQEAEDLEDEILTARRKVAKELATRNAQDLEAMLDMGRVNMARAQWLESNLEAGQAILLTEAKLLRTALRDGQMRPDDFDTIKAKLTADYEMIDTQLMRLRDFVDEDDVEEDEDLEEFEAQNARQEAESADDVKGRV